MIILKSGIVLPLVISSLIITFIIQCILCRFAKKAVACSIPFIMIICMCSSILLYIIMGMMSNIYEGAVILILLMMITTSLIADIAGWAVGLAWRGYNLTKLRGKEQEANPA